MKKSFRPLLLLLIAAQICYSQLPPLPGPPDPFSQMQNPQATYYDIINHANNYYGNNPSLDTAENGPGMSMARWQWFWENRVQRGDSVPGKFNYALQAMQNFIQNPICPASNPPCLNTCPTPSPVLANWTSKGPVSMPTQNMGAIWCVAVDPADPNPTNPNTVYAGTTNSGLWRTSNFSSPNPQWTNITDSLRMPIGINQIVFDPTNPNIMYLATGVSRIGSYGIGLLKTTNASAAQPSWTSPTTGLNFTSFSAKQVNKILIDPNSSPTMRIMYALVNDQIWKSYDNGDNWMLKYTMPSTSWNPRQFTDIEFDPVFSNVMYISGKDWNAYNGGALLYKSFDNIETTALLYDITSNLPDPNFLVNVEIEFSNSSNLLYVYYTNNNNTANNNGDDFAKLLTSSDLGITFNGIPSTELHPRFEISNDDPNVMYLFGGIHVKKSVNGGASFNFINPADYHVDVRDVKILLETPGGVNDIMLMGNDGGVSYITFNSSFNETHINKNGTGLDNVQFFGFDGHEQLSELLAGGSQDNDTYTYNSGNWIVNGACDGYETAIVPDCPNVMYGEEVCCWTCRSMIHSNNMGNNWGGLAQFSFQNAQINRPLQITASGKTIVGWEKLYSSVTPQAPQCSLAWTVSWNSIGPNVSGRKVAAFDVAESNNNIIYCAYEYLNAPVLNSGLLWKTTNGGTTWTELTANPNTATSLLNLQTLPILDIIVNPTNPDELWLTIGGFDDCGNNTGYGEHRVFHSSDGGLTFQDYSTGLTEFPVMCIAYEKGSNNALYVGTDVGVFYRNASMCRWECFSNGLPVVIVTDLEINHCNGKIRAATFGRGIWEADLVNSGQNQTITSNTTWSGNQIISSDLHISNNATLTISGPNTTVNINLGKRIIVERGSKLIIDGAKLTNFCGNYWEGIEVWGDFSQSQHTPGAQGEVVIRNNSIIEFAHEGITTIKNTPNGWDWNFAGGIVRCENSTFRNCKRSSQFLSYRNFNPNNPTITLNNLSVFKNCTFITDQDFRHSVFTGPNTHVSMFNVRGIQFLGCKFLNTAPSTQLNLRGKGITSIDASAFIVNDLSLSQQSMFSNLFYAIDAGASNPLHTLSVHNTDFVGNIHGILLNGINYATLSRNTFYLTSDYGSYGIYLNGCSKYLVESNEYNGLSAGLNIGLAVNNSGKDANQIYKNSYKLCYVGSLAMNLNDGPGLADGLRFNCEEHFNTDFDIAVTGFLNGSRIGLYQGICSNNPQLAVRNSYSNQNCNTFPESNFYVENSVSTQPINHGSTQGGSPPFTIPACSDPLIFSNYCSQIFNPTLDCPGNVCVPPSPPCLNARITAIEQEMTQLIQNIDGGNTLALLQQTQSNQPAGQLKQILLDASPYLSDTVLLTVLHLENPLPPGVLKEILVANAPLSPVVFNAIQNLTPPFPEGIFNEVLAAQTGTSAMQELQTEISLVTSVRELTVDNKVRYFLTDTTVVNGIDSVVQIFYEESRESEDFCELAGAKIAAGNLSGANAIIDSIHQYEPLDNYCKLLKTLIEIYDHIEHCYILQSDTSLAGEVGELIIDPYDKGCVNAQSILNLVFETDFPEEIILPNPQNNSRILQEPVPTGREWVQFYPSPAQHAITFDLNFPEEIKSTRLQIFDYSGKKVWATEIRSDNPKLNIDLSGFAIGPYFFTLDVNGAILESNKFIVIK